MPRSTLARLRSRAPGACASELLGMMSCRVMARIWARPGCLTTACPPRPSGDVPIAAALQHRHGGARILLRGKLDILGKTGHGKRLATGAPAEDGRKPGERNSRGEGKREEERGA